MKKHSKRSCPICDAGEAEVLHTQRFVLPEGHPLAEGYDVMGCDRCGFVYADTTVSQQDYDIFYAKFSKYEDNKTSTGGGGAAWDAERLEETAESIHEFLGNTEARVLDVGCANGGLLGCLKELGYTNLCGVDPSPVCVENAKKLYGIEAHAGSLSSSLLAGLEQFDCIILSHVLEHVQDLKLAMRHVRELLRTGGTLYVEVPDASRYADFVVAPFQDFNTEHINHFSSQCLLNLCGKSFFAGAAHGEKVINAAPEKPYPAAYGFYTKEVDGAESPAVEMDASLRKRINEYVAASRRIMDALEVKLRQVLGEHRQVIVWGTGQLVMKLLAETSLAGAQVVLVDGNPINHGKILCGATILAPEQIRETKHPIIIGSMLHEKAIADVIRNKMALTNEIISLN